MKIYIDTNADPKNALIAGQFDNQAATMQSLFYGDILPFEIIFTDGTGAIAEWAGQANVEILFALGYLVPRQRMAQTEALQYANNSYYTTLDLTSENLNAALAGNDSISLTFEIQLKIGSGQSKTLVQNICTVRNQLNLFSPVNLTAPAAPGEPILNVILTPNLPGEPIISIITAPIAPGVPLITGEAPPAAPGEPIILSSPAAPGVPIILTAPDAPGGIIPLNLMAPAAPGVPNLLIILPEINIEIKDYVENSTDAAFGDGFYFNSSDLSVWQGVQYDNVPNPTFHLTQSQVINFTNTTAAGEFYIFEKVNGNWVQKAQLSGSGAGGQYSGWNRTVQFNTTNEFMYNHTGWPTAQQLGFFNITYFSYRLPTAPNAPIISLLAPPGSPTAPSATTGTTPIFPTVTHGANNIYHDSSNYNIAAGSNIEFTKPINSWPTEATQWMTRFYDSTQVIQTTGLVALLNNNTFQVPSDFATGTARIFIYFLDDNGTLISDGVIIGQKSTLTGSGWVNQEQGRLTINLNII